MTDLSAGPGIWGPKVNEPDTSGRYPDPEAIRQKRVAELRGKITMLEQTNLGGRNTPEINRLVDDIARLRNERPKEGEYLGWPEAKFVPSPFPSPEPQDVREALEFYEREWRGNMEGDGSTPGLARTWMEPTDALLDDAGTKARNALAALARSNAQPVGALEFRMKRGEAVVYPWIPMQPNYSRVQMEATGLYEFRSAPPRPDASGLIEAAEWQKALEHIADQRLSDEATDDEYADADFECGYNSIIKVARDALRARAADRSAPRSDRGGA